MNIWQQYEYIVQAYVPVWHIHNNKICLVGINCRMRLFQSLNYNIELLTNFVYGFAHIFLIGIRGVVVVVVAATAAAAYLWI